MPLTLGRLSIGRHLCSPLARAVALPLVLLLALAPGHALAQLVHPPPMTPTADGRYRVGFNGAQLTLIDNAVFRTLLGDSTLPLFSDTSLTTSVRMTPQRGGADLVITYTNPTDDPQPMGAITLDGIRLPGTCRQWTFHHDATSRLLSGYTWRNHNIYPGDWYSPVMVAGDDRHILGFQILYPVVEYDQDVILWWMGVNETTTRGGPPHWSAQFRLGGDLPAGASRTYTIAIRATTAEESFVRTLVPYRDYFRARYGPVHYIRDARPIMGDSAATTDDVNNANRQGWTNGNLRPDVHGWGRWVDLLLNRRSLGYQRFMMWVPSGIFPAGHPLNFPYRFMTPINDYPVARDSMSQFLRFREAGAELGFWWGNSATLMREWASPTGERFNPNNSEHARLANMELDMAVRSGATMIGLDAHYQRSPTNMHRWITAMKNRAPNVKFITESASCDILHNLTPTFHESSAIRTPHILADFINPGHETWAALSAPAEAIREGRNPTHAEMAREAQRVAALGFVPLMYGPRALPSTLRAAESWRTTVPRDLQLPEQRPGRLSSQPVRRSLRDGGN